jgi:hypothetical protein
MLDQRRRLVIVIRALVAEILVAAAASVVHTIRVDNAEEAPEWSEVGKQ